MVLPTKALARGPHAKKTVNPNQAEWDDMDQHYYGDTSARSNRKEGRLEPAQGAINETNQIAFDGTMVAADDQMFLGGCTQ